MQQIQNEIHTAIFDFDNTLFDTEKLKKVLREIVMKYGTTEREATEVYKKALSEGDTNTFSISHFFGVLQHEMRSQGVEIPDAELQIVRGRIVESARALEGAQALLEECKQKKYNMYLLSLGVPEWQREKLELSGFKDYFSDDNIMYTRAISQGKVEALQERFGADFTGSGVMLFNDKPDETGALLSAFPDLQVRLRFDEEDKRYREDHFTALAKDFPGRVSWSRDLSDFTRELRKERAYEITDSQKY
ncbi:MAG: HAD hydrolase-like protein [Candidatus Magasanikbacteria bacterium]|nr:HAD hydrolase-like protein [Candidatus Magasanikbacteria bacterium]